MAIQSNGSIGYVLEFIEKNGMKFEHPVGMPPIISVNVPQKQYAWQVEQCLSGPQRMVGPDSVTSKHPLIIPDLHCSIQTRLRPLDQSPKNSIPGPDPIEWYRCSRRYGRYTLGHHRQCSRRECQPTTFLLPAASA
jgi:hypothetical protein